MTKDQLLAFIATRNVSEFQSNLQVQFDASACGFSVGELGQAFKLEEGGYRWWTPYGQLIEHPGGQMELIEDKQKAG